MIHTYGLCTAAGGIGIAGVLCCDARGGEAGGVPDVDVGVGVGRWLGRRPHSLPHALHQQPQSFVSAHLHVGWGWPSRCSGDGHAYVFVRVMRQAHGGWRCRHQSEAHARQWGSRPVRRTRVAQRARRRACQRLTSAPPHRASISLALYLPAHTSQHIGPLPYYPIASRVRPGLEVRPASSRPRRLRRDCSSARAERAMYDHDHSARSSMAFAPRPQKW
jgi:hypothetical protein